MDDSKHKLRRRLEEDGNLVLYTAAFIAENVRGGIRAVSSGQNEAAQSLGLKEGDRLRLVIIPQAIPVILPPFGNLVIEILKGTALVSLITLSDLAFEAQKLRVSHPAFRAAEVGLVIARSLELLGVEAPEQM